MKLHTKHSNIERGGVHSETAFTIKTNALSFSILSSGLYTDPIMAIVRELSCNAYDSHVDAHNADTPFEIHLPNDLEPFFSIKDFGTGLSDADIQGEVVSVTATDGTVTDTRTGGLYTTYFDSTKTNSNEFIGALGLGSKSPFSYADAFEVISIHGGTKHTYGIFLNEDGIPTVALMGKIETDEHSGLEIKLTIKREDFHTFYVRTATALKYFKVQPIVKGVVNFEFDPIPDKRIETDSWMLSKSSGYYNSSIVAVQGNVQYRVDSAQIKDLLDPHLQDFIVNANIVLLFDIGQLEVAANREEIRYDKQSADAIVEGIKAVYSNLTAEIESRIGSVSDNYWDACVDLNSLAAELFGSINFIRNHAVSDEIINPILRKYVEGSGNVSFDPIYGYNIFRYTLLGGYSSDVKTKRQTMPQTYTPNSETVVIINDVKIGGIKRLGEYLLDTPNAYKAILITKRKEPHSQYDDENNILPYIGYDKELSTLKDQLGNPTVLLLSEITEAPEKKTNSIVGECSIYNYYGLRSRHRGYYNTEYTCRWEIKTHDFEDGGIFIPLKYGTKPATMGDDKKLSEVSFGEDETVDKVLKFLVQQYSEKYDTDYTHYDLYGLPTTMCKRAMKLDNWINLFDIVDDLVLDLDGMVEYQRRYVATTNYNIITESVKKFEFVEMVKALPKKSHFRKVLMPLIEGSEKYTASNVLNADCVIALESVLSKKEHKPPVPFYDRTTFDKYGMLKLITDLQYNTDWEILSNYIKMTDRSK